MEHMKFETPDMVEGNIDKIAELFPSAITEMQGEDGTLKKSINFEALRQLLSPDVVDGEEHYEFTWVGKKMAIAGANRSIQKVLRPCVDKSVDWDTTKNIYIEGDNLEALKLLQESYLGKVDAIYIDPPYNTGSNLIYKNNFFRTEEEYQSEEGTFDSEGNKLFVNTQTNGRFHSDWCSMMYARLILARNLLKKEDGVLVCAIDQSEVNSLGFILAELFADKELTLVTVVHNPSGTQGENFSYCNEYLYFVYDGSKRSIALEERNDENADIRSFMNGAKGNTESYLRSSGYNSFYPIFVKENAIVGFGAPVSREVHPLDCNIKREDGIVEIYPIDGDGIERKWLFSRESVENIREELQVKLNSRRNRLEVIRIKNKINYKTVWTDKKYNAKQYGTILLNKLFDCPFTFPKSLYAVEESLKAALNGKRNALVLDFFSGSATTAHAVLALNAIDKGSRRFIMVQLPENIESNKNFKTICDIGEERIRRAGDKLRAEHPDAHLDTGFRVFRVDESNMKDVYYHPEEYTQEAIGGMVSNIKEDRTDLDLLYACLLDWGVELHLPHTSQVIDGCTVHNVDNGALMACFHADVPDSVVRAMAAQHPVRAVFRDSAFASDDAKINVTEIFKNLSPDTQVKVI